MRHSLHEQQGGRGRSSRGDGAEHIRSERHHRRSEASSRKINKREGAQTFRRGKAIAFYEMMELKCATIKKQLATPELQTINPILVGELKAVETLMSEFASLFELYSLESTTYESNNDDIIDSTIQDK